MTMILMIWIWQQDDYSNEHPIHLDTMMMIVAVAVDVVDIAEVVEEAMNDDDDDVDCVAEGVGNQVAVY